MTRLDTWLKQATRHLSKGSVAQVRTEIQEHYESARETAMSGGATQPGSVHLIYDERASVAGGVTGEESGAEPWIWD